MKKLVITFALTFGVFGAGTVYSAVEGSEPVSQININMQDVPLQDIVAELNRQCEGQVEPISTQYPEKEVSLDLRAFTCEDAASAIETIDSTYEESARMRKEGKMPCNKETS